MKTMDNALEKPSYWQRKYSRRAKLMAPCTSAKNFQAAIGTWPKDTYLQRRLQRDKWSQPNNRNLN